MVVTILPYPTHMCLACRELKEENNSLRQELASFTPDFWEELEDLKHAHVKAEQKCKEYAAKLGVT